MESGQVERLRLLEAALSSSADGVVVVDVNGHLVFINDAGRSITQRPPVTGIPTEQRAADYRLRYPDGRPVPPEKTPLGRARRGETVVDFPLMFARPDGTDGYTSNTASPVRDDEGRIVGAIAVFRDVTQQKRNEEQAEAVRRAHDELELRVKERTAELAKANEKLLIEIAYRQRVEDELRFLAEAGRVLSSSLDCEATLHNAARLAVPTMADCAVVDTLDEEGEIRRSIVAHADPTKAEALREYQRRYPPNASSPVATVLHTGKSMLVPEVPDSLLEGAAHDAGHLRLIRELAPRSFIIVPIVVEGRTLGAITFFMAESGRRYDEEYLTLADTFARRVALVIDNARLFEAERKARIAAETAQARLQLVVANSPDNMFCQDPEFRYIWAANPPPPLTSTNVLGKTDFDLLPSQDAQRLMEIKRNVLATGLGERVSIHVRVNGIERDFDVALEPLRDGENRIIGIAGYAHDVTEQVRASNRIAELAEVAQRRAAEMQSVLDNMMDGVFVFGADGVVTLVNDAGLRFLGVARFEDVIPALASLAERSQIRFSDGRPIGPQDMSHARALSGETIALEGHIIYHPAAHRDSYVQVSATPIRNERNEIDGAVVVLRDVTELTEFDRLKDQFIDVAAHELKTPITIMKGYAQALQRLPEGTPAPRRVLDAISRGADRIDGIVNDLLDISRLELGQLGLAVERIDLPELVDEIVERIALTATKHRIQVTRADPVVVRGDRDRLEQVLVNLVDNAARYSPRGGDVDVAMVVGEQEVVISVRDYGVGIPLSKQTHMFQRFYRAHTGTPYDYGGMGVGLYISKEIVARHGGHMWFQSEEGKGSTFCFSLPVGGGG